MPGGLFGIVAALNDYDTEQRVLSHKATYAEICRILSDTPMKSKTA